MNATTRYVVIATHRLGHTRLFYIQLRMNPAGPWVSQSKHQGSLPAAIREAERIYGPLNWAEPIPAGITDSRVFRIAEVDILCA